MFVRSARIEDVEAIALIMAALAEEGLIATEPPVDLEAQARRFREVIEAESPTAAWVLEDAGRVVGNADEIADSTRSAEHVRVFICPAMPTLSASSVSRVATCRAELGAARR